MLGVDASFLQEIEDAGGPYTQDGVPKDALQIFRDYGINYVRIRLWHTPGSGYNDLNHALVMAQRVNDLGMKILLLPHYSDTWADPGHQAKPAAWEGLPFDALKDSLYQYNRTIVTAMKAQNTLPDMISIGNEITNGMLWDDGRVGGPFNTPEQWSRLGELMKEAVSGVRDALGPGEEIATMVHIDRGGDNAGSRWFFDNLMGQGVEFDAIGLSYYSRWHGGSLQVVESNMKDLAQRYGKDVYIIETAYPWTLGWADEVNNLWGSADQLLPGYEPTVEGQRSYLRDLRTIMDSVPENRGKGICYWSPEYIAFPGFGSPWENVALFDFKGEILPSVGAFFWPDEYSLVTFRLNTSSIPDTIHTDAVLQIRGDINGTSPDSIPGGYILDWGQQNTITLRNVGGDYFEKWLYVPTGAQLRFKFWSPDAGAAGLNNGWDTGTTGTDGFGNTIVSVAGDTLLPLHFFNATDDRQPYDWRWWESEQGSIAVLFRVFMNTIEGVSDGYDPCDGQQLIGLRGDNLGGLGPLSWGTSTITLERERADSASSGYHLYSGVMFYSLAASGLAQQYKFVIEPNVWEEGNITGNRSFVVPDHDTTLHWVYYGDTAPIPANTAPEQGDVNSDGQINVLDILAVINHILGAAPLTGEPLDRADCNNDGQVNILDALGIVNVVLGIGECQP